MEKRQRTDDGAEPRCRYLRVNNLPGAAGGAPELRALLEPHGKVEDVTAGIGGAFLVGDTEELSAPLVV